MQHINWKTTKKIIEMRQYSKSICTKTHHILVQIRRSFSTFYLAIRTKTTIKTCKTTKKSVRHP